jgi:glutamine---fructose-6-phosphate transaminase (isomerizing)
MCGIVGFYGSPKNLLNTLVGGLKRLEYRGYDSAGVAITTQEQKLYIRKAVGKVAQLDQKIGLDIDSNTLPNFGNVGIAHTRWATHGEPTEDNAHPHFSFDNKVAVVHNGIIENYKELKAELEADGVKFISKTDTEAVAHLIAKNYHGDLKQAVLTTLKKLKGAFAFAIIHTNEPNRLIGAKKGSPLLLGVGENEIVLASDVSAVISCTRNVIYLEDGEMVDINEGNYRVTDFEDMDISKTIQKVDWSDDEASKGGYEHYLIKEIMDQGSTLIDSTRGRLNKETGNVIFGGLLDVKKRIDGVKKIILLGIGTSYYACKLGEMYFEELTGIPTKAEMSPEFRFKANTVDKHTWVIAVSQSGETFDTISAINEAKQKGALVTGIVNVVGSTIARITDAGVYNHIGPEISVASTKAFTSQALLLLMHAIYVGRTTKLSLSQGQELVGHIQNLNLDIKEVLAQNDNISTLAQKYHTSKDFFYLGTKFNYPIALEGALKLKEISYLTHAEGLSSGELKHGFIALVDENRPSFVLATNDTVFDKSCNAIEQIKARKGKVLAVVSDAQSPILSILDDYIVVPQTDERIQPIINNVVFQLFAYHCSRLNGFDVDRPRNLAKSVTVE